MLDVIKKQKNLLFKKKNYQVKWFNIDEIIMMIKEGKTSFKENRIKLFEKIKSDF